MLKPLLGSKTRELVLYYLMEHGEGYARAIASEEGCALDTVQKQLKRLEKGGVVKSRTLGRTRVYVLNPDYPLKDELLALLRSARRLADSGKTLLPRQSDSKVQSRYIVRRID